MLTTRYPNIVPELEARVATLRSGAGYETTTARNQQDAAVRGFAEAGRLISAAREAEALISALTADCPHDTTEYVRTDVEGNHAPRCTTCGRTLQTATS